MDPTEEAKEILMLFGKGGDLKIMDSGGKDSSVLKAIAMECRDQYGLEFEIVHNHTTLDAPETVYFIRDERDRFAKEGVKFSISYPDITFDKLCVKKKMLPTRLARFCCEKLKERSTMQREKTATGVRRSESTARKQNQGAVTVFSKNGKPFEDVDEENFRVTPKGGMVLLNFDNAQAVETVYTCFRTNKVLINPLINWTDDDVWRYISDNKVPVNPLYECGFSRIGCVGCPMASYKGRMAQFARYPKFKERYIRIADKIVQGQKDARNKKGQKLVFDNGLDYFRHWIEDPNIKGQLSFDEDGNIFEDYT